MQSGPPADIPPPPSLADVLAMDNSLGISWGGECYPSSYGIVWHHDSPDVEGNLISIDHLPTTPAQTNALLDAVEASGHHRARRPALSFIHDDRMEDLYTSLNQRGFHHYHTQVWLLKKIAVSAPPFSPSLSEWRSRVTDNAADVDFMRVFARAFACHENEVFCLAPGSLENCRILGANQQPIPHCHVIGYSGNTPVACTTLYLFGSTAVLWDVGVVPQLRGSSGVAKNLMADVEQAARARGMDYLTCYTIADTRVAEGYLKWGFQEIGRTSIWAMPEKELEMAAAPLAAD